MIQLTRIRHGEAFYLNPDLFERVDTHVDTVIRLTDGTEYVVVEPAAEIVRKIAHFRAQIIAIAAMLQSSAFASTDDDAPTTAERRDHAELSLFTRDMHDPQFDMPPPEDPS